MALQGAIVWVIDAATRSQIEAEMRRSDFRPITVSSLQDLIGTASEYPACVILASLDAPGFDPKQLRRDLSGTVDCFHMILVLNEYNPRLVSSAFRAGADDIIVQPLIPAELRSRLQLASRTLALEELCTRLEQEASLFDEIAARASFHSRRYLDAQLSSELTRACRFRHALSLVLAHVDSEPWDGRQVRTLGNFLSRHFRSKVDWIARYDEHHLAFVLPETELTGAVRAIRRLEKVLSGAADTAKLPSNLSINFGVTAVEPQHLTTDKALDPEALLKSAEAHLHQARQDGRDIVAAPLKHH